MSLAVLYSRALSGMEAALVTVEDGAWAAARSAGVGSEIGKLLAEDLNVAALVTLEDRVQRVCSA